jgi:hypothetical protein
MGLYYTCEIVNLYSSVNLWITRVDTCGFVNLSSSVNLWITRVDTCGFVNLSSCVNFWLGRAWWGRDESHVWSCQLIFMCKLLSGTGKIWLVFLAPKSGMVALGAMGRVLLWSAFWIAGRGALDSAVLMRYRSWKGPRLKASGPWCTFSNFWRQNHTDHKMLDVSFARIRVLNSWEGSSRLSGSDALSIVEGAPS